MRRGFKAEAERRADAARQHLGLDPIAPVYDWAYAEFRKVTVFDFETLNIPRESVAAFPIPRGGVRNVIPEWAGAKSAASRTV